jgi:hypothetical protein
MLRKSSILLGSIILVVTMGALVLASPREHTLYLTFNQTIAIPGATLTPGTYIFEEPAPDTSPSVVRVLSRDRQRVFLTQSTTRVERPAGLPAKQSVVLSEPQPNEPEQIVSWFEPGLDLGWAFRY